MLIRVLRNIFSRPLPRIGDAPIPLTASSGPNVSSVALASRLKSVKLALNQGRYTDAAKACHLLVSQVPQNTNAWALLFSALKSLGDLDKAVEYARRLIALDPASASLWVDVGKVLIASHHYSDAETCLCRALEISPNLSDALSQLASLYIISSRLTDAEDLIRRAQAYGDHSANSLSNLGLALTLQGRANEATPILEKALSRDSQLYRIWQARLRNALCDPTLLPEQARSLAERFQVSLEQSIFNKHRTRQFLCLNAPKSKIRVAYLSSDFRTHPVAYNMLPIITRHDRHKFEIYLYFDGQEDQSTSHFRSACTQWRNVFGKGDAEIAAEVAKDEIDILVILAGRFDHNHLLTAAYRAAPIQVSYHDPATSGLKSMDYLITDSVLSPKNSLETFTETLLRLPSYYVHEPILDAPKVSGLSLTKREYLTFGCVNNPAKLNLAVVSCWSEILQSTPNSRLLLKYNNVFRDSKLVAYYVNLFQQKGIEQDRIVFDNRYLPRGEHLAVYHEIDIALDPFPFTGATTTFEALWMGVPVITLAGDRMVARWGASMMRAVNLGELVADSVPGYVGLAVSLATNKEQLIALRSSLRERVRHSPLCNGHRRTQQLERLFRYIWRKYRASQQPN